MKAFVSTIDIRPQTSSSEAARRRKLAVSPRMTYFPMARVPRVIRALSEATSLVRR